MLPFSATKNCLPVQDHTAWLVQILRLEPASQGYFFKRTIVASNSIFVVTLDQILPQPIGLWACAPCLEADGKDSDLRWFVQVAESHRLRLPELLLKQEPFSRLPVAAVLYCWAGHSSLSCDTASAILVFTWSPVSHVMDFVERIIMFTQLCLRNRLRTLFRFEHWQSLMWPAFQQIHHVPLAFCSHFDSMLPWAYGLPQYAE